MRPLFILVRKDFVLFFRNKAALVLTFIVPFMLIWVFGQVFGVNRKDAGPGGIPLAVVNASGEPGAAKLVAALQAEKTFKVVTTRAAEDKTERLLREDDLAALMRSNNFRFALVIPEDLFSEKTIGLHLKIYSNPRNEMESKLVNGILQKTIISSAPQLLVQSLTASGRGAIGAEGMAGFNRSVADDIAASFGGDPEQILKGIESGDLTGRLAPGGGGDSSEGSLMSRLIRVESIQVAGQHVKSPAATRIVGGWAIQFLMFALSSAAAALFHERDQGIFHRLLAGPVSRAQILWSKFVFGILIGMVQLVTLFVAGRLLYGIDVEHHIGFLLLVCAFAAAACTSFGMLLAAISRSPEAATGLATFLILLMCAVGGAWIPVTMMPEFIQQASKFTLVYWAIEGFSQVLWADATFFELLPTLGVLGGMTAAVMGLAVWRFNRGKIFS